MELYVVCTHYNHLNEVILMSTLNIQSLCRKSKRFPKLSLFASWTGAMINPQWLELPMSRTNFHGPKDVRAIEVQLFLQCPMILRICSKGPDQAACKCRLIWAFNLHIPWRDILTWGSQILVRSLFAWCMLTLSTLGKNFSRQFEISFLIFPENRLWHFMPIVSSWDDLHGMSNVKKIVFGNKEHTKD